MVRATRVTDAHSLIERGAKATIGSGSGGEASARRLVSGSRLSVIELLTGA